MRLTSLALVLTLAGCGSGCNGERRKVLEPSHAEAPAAPTVTAPTAPVIAAAGEPAPPSASAPTSARRRPTRTAPIPAACCGCSSATRTPPATR